MPNIIKVVYGNTTLIDLTDSTLSSADQLAQGVTAYDRSGTKLTGTATGGGTAAISIVDTPDAGGGDVRTITALDISDTTATASDVINSKWFYTADGTKTQGTAVAGDNVLVVTLSWDDDYFGQDDGAWIPDATFAEIQAAYQAEKQVVVTADTALLSYCQYSGISFVYAVADMPNDVAVIGYSYNGNGVTRLGTQMFYDTSEATISSNGQLLNGIKAVGSDGTLYTGNIPTKTSSDLSANGATVTAPAGYYASNATKTIASGTEGTPTATKGTVSNHAVTVTPSVTNVAGYISGGTHTGTAVSVSASELVSGTLSVTSSGTKDVTNYASASVPSGTAGTPTATKGTVSNHSVSVTPSVTNQTGWITGSTINGTAVTVSASELVSGSETKTSNGTYDVTNLASLVVAVPVVTYYTGSTAPSSSLGSNGDIYLQTGS